MNRRMAGRAVDILHSLKNLFFPRFCPVCGCGLADGERYLCMLCESGLPRVRAEGGVMPDVERFFIGDEIVVAAVSFFHYDRLSRYSEILKDIKYRNRPQAAALLAKRFAEELAVAGFFDDVDLILPVPLHRTKQMKRGYNQSRYIAEGISAVSGVPAGDNLVAVAGHGSQTSKSAEERRRNVEGVFAVEGDLSGKCVLVVDDVITTGATVSCCCSQLRKAGVERVKVLSLAIAGNSL